MADSSSSSTSNITQPSRHVVPGIRKEKGKFFSRTDLAPPLTIRNVTGLTVQLKVIERYEAPLQTPVRQGGESGGGDDLHGSKPVKSFSRNVTSFMSNIKSAADRLASNGSSISQEPAPPRLADNAQSFERRELDVRIDPFQVYNSDIAATARAPTEILRVTIEVDGLRYRIDTPSPKNDSQTFTALQPSSAHELTGVFIPQDTFLAIYNTANLRCWMHSLLDETPLSALSIPGTHNSPTCYRALPSVRCQAVSPRQQLENGVRMFDVRVQPNLDSEQLHLVHGAFPVSLTGPKYFWDLLKQVYEFLDENPSETLIMSIKREGKDDATDMQMSHLLFEAYVKPDADRWYTAPRIPTLGEARGKIVLLRRFDLADFVRQHSAHEGGEWAIDATQWADNTPCDLQRQLCVQDFYQVMETENIEKKISYATAQLARAAACVCTLPGLNTDKEHPVPPQPLYMNFLSGSNFWKSGCWPEKIAARLNPAIIAYLCEKHAIDAPEADGHGGGDTTTGGGDGSTGVVVCDWVGDDGDWDLVRCIVGMNSKLIMREWK